VPKYIRYRANAVNADAYNEVRIITFIDRQSNGTAPALADVLEAIGTPTNTMMRWDNRKRFKILRDVTIATDTDDPQENRDIYIPLKNVKTVYNNLITGLIADIISGAIYHLFVSDSGVVSHPTLACYTRFVYTA